MARISSGSHANCRSAQRSHSRASPAASRPRVHVAANAPTARGQQILARLLPATAVLGACVGAAECNSLPAHAPPLPAHPLKCGDPGEKLLVEEAWMDYE